MMVKMMMLLRLSPTKFIDSSGCGHPRQNLEEKTLAGLPAVKLRAAQGSMISPVWGNNFELNMKKSLK